MFLTLHYPKCRLMHCACRVFLHDGFLCKWCDGKFWEKEGDEERCYLQWCPLTSSLISRHDEPLTLAKLPSAVIEAHLGSQHCSPASAPLSPVATVPLLFLWNLFKSHQLHRVTGFCTQAEKLLLLLTFISSFHIFASSFGYISP